MKFDVMEWINSCSQCSLTMGKKAHGAEAERSEMLLQTLQSPDPDSDRFCSLQPKTPDVLWYKDKYLSCCRRLRF